MSTQRGGAFLAAGLALLAFGAGLGGYGLCMLVNSIEGAAVFTGSGSALTALSTIFIVRSRQAR